MTDRDAILAGIFANPDEDVPRLAFADCIQEDDPRYAEFIRVQVELARHQPIGVISEEVRGEHGVEGHVFRGHKWAPETEALQRREYDLWREHGPNFCAALPGEAGACLPGCHWSAGVGDAIGYWFGRGFVDRVECAGRRWVEIADAVMAASPAPAITLASLPPVHASVKDRRRGDVVYAGDRVTYTLQGRTFRFDVPIEESRRYEAGGPYRRGMILELLRREWPRVRVWNVP